MNARDAQRARLHLEWLEAREVPAVFAIQLLSEASNTGATHSSTVALVTADPAPNGGILVTADSAGEAALAALTGGVDVAFAGQTATYAYSPTAVTTDPDAHDQPYLLSQLSAYRWRIGLEDLAAPNMQAIGTDWDYNDRTWELRVQEYQEGMPVVTVAKTADATEGSTTPGMFTFTRTGYTSDALTVNLGIGANGFGDLLATLGADYTLATSSGGTLAQTTSGYTLTFAPGVTTVDVSVTALDDDLTEGTEGFRVSILWPDIEWGYMIGNNGEGGTADVRLTDDPQLKLSDGTAFRGVFDVPSVLSTNSSDSVILSTTAGTNISLFANPAISSGELYQLDIAIGDGQINFATLDGVQLSTTPPPTTYPPDAIPTSVRLIGTISALNAALANSVYTAANNPNGVEQDTIQLRLSGLGERVGATGTTLGLENHVWVGAVGVKREKPTGPAPMAGETQTLQGAGSFAIPRNSFVGITDKTVSGDSFWLDTARPTLSSTQKSGITSWDDLITKMEAAKPEGGYGALVISGHGSGGGAQASGGDLNASTLTQAQADKLKAMLKEGAPVILCSCKQGTYVTSCRSLARKFDRPVIANEGNVSRGNSGAGDWVRINP